MPRMTLAKHREDARVENGGIELGRVQGEGAGDERDGMVAQALDAVRCNVMLMERRIEARQRELQEQQGAAAGQGYDERARYYSSEDTDSDREDETGF